MTDRQEADATVTPEADATVAQKRWHHHRQKRLSTCQKGQHRVSYNVSRDKNLTMSITKKAGNGLRGEECNSVALGI